MNVSRAEELAKQLHQLAEDVEQLQPSGYGAARGLTGRLSSQKPNLDPSLRGYDVPPPHIEQAMAEGAHAAIPGGLAGTLKHEAAKLNMDTPERMEATAKGRVVISKEFMFEAAHVLPLHKGKCAQLHGHSWQLTVAVDGFVDPDCGFVCDYGDLKEIVHKHIINKVDHAYLGQLNYYPKGSISGMPLKGVLGADFYPSSENLVVAFKRILEPRVRELGQPWQDVRLYSVKLNETCTSECEWRRNG